MVSETGLRLWGILVTACRGRWQFGRPSYPKVWACLGCPKSAVLNPKQLEDISKPKPETRWEDKTDPTSSETAPRRTPSVPQPLGSRTFVSQSAEAVSCWERVSSLPACRDSGHLSAFPGVAYAASEPSSLSPRRSLSKSASGCRLHGVLRRLDLYGYVGCSAVRSQCYPAPSIPPSKRSTEAVCARASRR